MISPRTWSLLVLGGLLGTAAGGQAQEPASAFGPGEQASYRVSYLGITAGTALITVGDLHQQGHEIWPIVTRATSGRLLGFFPIRDQVVTYWDANDSQTLGQDFTADENHKRRHQIFQLDHRANTAVVTKQKEGEHPTEDRLPILPGTQDVTAATFLLRNLVTHVGQTVTIPVFTGNKTFPLKATVLDKETLQTGMGPREVYKVEVETDFSGKLHSRRNMFAYLTTDRSHLPVRIEADFLLGKVVADLTEYKQGRAVAAAELHHPPG